MIPAFRQKLWHVARIARSAKDTIALGPNRPGSGWNEVLVQELAEYPNGLTVDILDCMAYTDPRWGGTAPPESERETERRLDREWGIGQGRDPITGY